MKVLTDYQNACNAIIIKFEKKHGYEFSGWVADEIGGIAEFINQYYFSMNEIVYDLQHKVKKGLIFEWQDKVVNEEVKMNFKNYAKYGEVKWT